MTKAAEQLPEHDARYGLHRLLGALLSKLLSTDEKLDIIETEYGIPIEYKIRRDVIVMCNLLQGIRDDEKTKVIMNMHKKGYTSEQIAEIVEKTIEEV